MPFFAGVAFLTSFFSGCVADEEDDDNGVDDSEEELDEEYELDDGDFKLMRFLSFSLWAEDNAANLPGLYSTNPSKWMELHLNSEWVNESIEFNYYYLLFHISCGEVPLMEELRTE